jgi:hypothetical protein
MLDAAWHHHFAVRIHLIASSIVRPQAAPAHNNTKSVVCYKTTEAAPS